MGIDEVLTAPRSPWQNPYVERLIGSMRREGVDHVIVLNERSLQRVLRSYIDYYQHWRTHLALGKDPPVSRIVEPAASGEVIARPHVGGLHHSYHRPRGLTTVTDGRRRKTAPAVDSTERRSAILTLALVCRLQAAAIGHSDGADEVFGRHTGRRAPVLTHRAQGRCSTWATRVLAMWPVRGCVQWTRCQGRTISVGTSISLRVAGTDIDWAKNGPGENHGPLFQDNDLTRLRSEQLDYDRVDPNDSDLAREEIAFAKQLSGLVPRLELLGFTLKQVEAEYSQTTQEHAEKAEALDEESERSSPRLMTFPEFCAFVSSS